MSRVYKTIMQRLKAPSRTTAILAALPLVVCLSLAGSNAGAVDDAYHPPSDTYTGQSGVDTYRPGAPPSGAYQPSGRSSGDAYQPSQGAAGGDAYEPPSGGSSDSYQPSPNSGDGGYGAYNGPRDGNSGSTGYGEPYRPPQNSASRDEHYQPGPPPYNDGPPHGTYSEDEVIRAGNNFFGKVSGGLASAVEWAFQKAGRPNGYILGQDAGGAFIAGLAYGEGTLYTKDAGSFKVYWQGPSVGYDFGADGSKVMTLVYNLRDPSDIFDRFGGVEGAAYLIGGVSVQLQKAGHVTLAPIRAGVGLRLGANVGYSKYTRGPTWNPF
jgi:hypothetical protein